MPSGSYKQADVRCPFYKFDDGKRRITCEGIIDGSSLILSYNKKRDYENQIDVFCCQHYDKCEVYRLLMEKYDEEECTMASQCEIILNHLRNHGSISHKEAEGLYGIARLAARVSDLKDQGVDIVSEIVTGKNRYGKTTHYARYYLREDDTVEIIKPKEDSQYRLRRCKCGSDNVAYVLGADGHWRVRCFDCGETGDGYKVQHEAQVKWNGVC